MNGQHRHCTMGGIRYIAEEKIPPRMVPLVDQHMRSFSAVQKEQRKTNKAVGRQPQQEGTGHMGAIAQLKWSMSEFRNELDAHESHLLLGVVVLPKLLERCLDAVRLRLAEVFIDLLLLVLIYHLVDVVSEVDLGA